MEIIKPIKIGGNRVERIDRIPPPVTTHLEPTVVRGLQVPVVDVPIPRLKYPRIEIPSSDQFDGGAPGKEEAKEEEPKEKTRELPEPSVPSAPPVPKMPVALPPNLPPPDTVQVSIAGFDVNVPSPKAVVEAGATAVIGTSATLVTALLFNQARQAAAPALQKAVRNKFKIKLKQVKPVLHFVEENGEVHVIRYDGGGVRLLNNHVENPEQYLRDLVDADHLFEADHRIIIDEPIKKMFTKEGAERFRYFVSPKKLAKKLAARFSF